MPHSCGERAFNKPNLLNILWVFCALLLPGCGESTPRGYAGSPTAEASDTLQPITAPPRAGESPPLPGTTGAQKTPDGLPALTAKGVNTRLFAAPIDDEISRMERLENAVQELRNDFDAMAPAIVRLVAIEKDIQNLITQLEVLTGSAPALPVEPIDEAMLEAPMDIQPATAPSAPNEMPEQIPAQDNIVPASPPPATAQEQTDSALQTGLPAPAAAPPEPKAAAPPPVVAAAAVTPAPIAQLPSGASVTAVRVGAHPGKMRIVLDATKDAPFTADLDSVEKILLVELHGTAWDTAPAKTYAGNPILASYTAEPMDGGGTRLIFTLKTASNILYSGAMGDAGPRRIIIDISAP